MHPLTKTKMIYRAFGLNIASAISFLDMTQTEGVPDVVITYGKKKENIAVIIPYAEYQKKNSIRLGLLKDKKMAIHRDFEMSEDDLINP